MRERRPIWIAPLVALFSVSVEERASLAAAGAVVVLILIIVILWLGEGGGPHPPTGEWTPPPDA